MAQDKHVPSKEEERTAMSRPDLVTSPDQFHPVCGLQFTGNEFAPEIEDGDLCVFNVADQAQAGDIVAIWMKPEFVYGNKPQVSVWKLHFGIPPYVTFPHSEHPKSEVAALLMLRTDDPKKCATLRCDRVLAVHRMQEVRGPDGLPRKGGAE